MLTEADLARLLEVWRTDPRSTYATWFLWEERLKNFRSIRQGIQAVVAEMEAGTFGTAYRGSSLETVVHSIAEQRQIFRGADHAFLWKPKLRIPDIYESPENQLAFARFLRTCLCCSTDDALVAAVHTLDAHRIKGLGPAVANLLYFLHPTIAPPSNTAILRGFAALTGAPAKLGRWSDYLAMRQAILRLTDQHRQRLSNDLGAVAGFLYDIGSGLLPVPAADGDHAAWSEELERIAAEARKLAAEQAGPVDGSSHTAVQALLRDLGRDLGFQVHIASNDRNRPVGEARLGDGCLADLPEAIRDAPGSDSVRLIDVLWIDSAGQVAAAFEVEHTTSIYSGIVRMLDLAMGVAPTMAEGLFLVAPDDREDEVRQQLARPAFQRTASLHMRYLPYGELRRHADSIRRFGSGLKPILAIAKPMHDHPCM
jgi:type II restriction enzyme